jgi:hypothetical protein
LGTSGNHSDLISVRSQDEYTCGPGAFTDCAGAASLAGDVRLLTERIESRVIRRFNPDGVVQARKNRCAAPPRAPSREGLSGQGSHGGPRRIGRTETNQSNVEANSRPSDFHRLARFTSARATANMIREKTVELGHKTVQQSDLQRCRNKGCQGMLRNLLKLEENYETDSSFRLHWIAGSNGGFGTK